MTPSNVDKTYRVFNARTSVLKCLGLQNDFFQNIQSIQSVFCHQNGKVYFNGRESDIWSL
jgi:hypothetical protein